MPVRQDLPDLSPRQTLALLTKAPDTLISNEKARQLNRSKLTKELLHEFDVMHRNPYYAKPVLIGVITMSSPFLEQEYNAEMSLGQDDNGNYIYATLLSAECMVMLSNDNRVLAMDDGDAYKTRQHRKALKEMNHGKLCERLQQAFTKGPWENFHGVTFTSSESVAADLDAKTGPDLACRSRPYQQEKGLFIQTLGRPSAREIAFLSNDPRVIEVMDSRTYSERVTLVPAKLSGYTPPPSLASDFARACTTRTGRAFAWLLRVSLEDEATLDLRNIVEKVLTSALQDQFHSARISGTIKFSDSAKERLQFKIEMEINALPREQRTEFGKQILDSLLACIVENPVVAHTKAYNAGVRLYAKNGELMATRFNMI